MTVEESARDLEAVRQQQAAVEARLGELEKRSLRAGRAAARTSGRDRRRVTRIWTRASPPSIRGCATRSASGTGSRRPSAVVLERAPRTRRRSRDTGGRRAARPATRAAPDAAPGTDRGSLAETTSAPGARYRRPRPAVSESDAQAALRPGLQGPDARQLLAGADRLSGFPAAQSRLRTWPTTRSTGSASATTRSATTTTAIQEFLKVQEAYPRGRQGPGGAAQDRLQLPAARGPRVARDGISTRWWSSSRTRRRRSPPGTSSGRRSRAGRTSVSRPGGKQRSRGRERNREADLRRSFGQRWFRASPHPAPLRRPPRCVRPEYALAR